VIMHCVEIAYSGLAFLGWQTLTGCNEYDIYSTLANLGGGGYNGAYVKWRTPTVS